MEPLGRPAASALAGSPVSENARDRWRLRREGAELLPRRRRRIPRRLCATPRWTETTTRETARGVFELARPGNCIAAAVLTGTGAFVAGASDALAPAAIAAVTTAFAVAAGNAIINDYFDREIDAINQPDRPIPRGAVSPRRALGISGVWFAAAVALARWRSRGWRSPSPVSTSPPSSPTRRFLRGRRGSATLSSRTSWDRRSCSAALPSAAPRRSSCSRCSRASTFAREVIKDVEDVVGDREEGLHTLPVAIGERRSLWVATGSLVVAVAASPFPYLSGTFGGAYLPRRGRRRGHAVMLYACYEAFTDPAAAQQRFKYGTFLAAVAFVVGRAALLI